ncbi:Sec-independent protein translocase subunit TatA [Streptomyces sp. BE20]|uniref:Sec-independent protein translocase subunit TatA n=1 Tax=unclassified Streptomyces TaxID=2593676 RepID=UPI002E78D82B|nr:MULTISPECIES: Sec-independent protein translocase subunit TatA [unclassified Streptomyces]MED7948918.1 Sec-independent protein translocase subunit TatA [Streptomyces sp. BE303]MEE1820901.1 Sec-independent protein translocase subunit TatA [Streptomyces sp. BE20]
MLRNGLEPWHLVVVILVILLLFGSKKLPDAARGLGKSLRILKAETRALHEDDPADATSDTATDAVTPILPTLDSQATPNHVTRTHSSSSTA